MATGKNIKQIKALVLNTPKWLFLFLDQVLQSMIVHIVNISLVFLYLDTATC
jgi:hypothetical protein